jgi:tripartite-type tricarboxylate transporter receptor subunit TctC
MKLATTLTFIAALTVCVCKAAIAGFPERPLTLVAPFAAGGSSDIVARSMAPLLAERLGRAVVVENVSGAGGVIGTDRVVRASPDGYTLLLGSGSELLINKLINPKTPYDGLKDLAPVVFVGTGAMVLIGKPQLQPATLAELLALARRNPGALSYASAGTGTPMHVAGELLKIKGGVAMTHVPYRGAAPAINDVLAGQIDLAVVSLSAALPHIRAGSVKAYAVTSARRSELAPQIAPVSDTAGLAGFDLGIWFGLFVPAKTPAAVVQVLRAAALPTLADPQLRKRLLEAGIEPSGDTAEQLSAFMRDEFAKYRKVVEQARITVE